MPSVCFYFQVHQPYRVKRYKAFDIGHDDNYFNVDSDDDTNNKKVLQKVANKCYLPTNQIMLDLLNQHPDFKISYSLSGVFLEQCEEFAPEVIESFKKLASTGRVEFLGETYYHSLAALYSVPEFERQVVMHREKIRKLFGVEPKVFRNTELIYNNDIATMAEKLGFSGVVAEGADHILGWKSPNFVYKPKTAPKMGLLLKNYRLSDDIAFRFSSQDWADWPLSAEKFTSWLSAVNGGGDVVNLFMDYETFGEHQWEDTGIFDFLRALPGEILKHPDNNFMTVSEVIDNYDSIAELDAPHHFSWADTERDLSAWLSNSMQHDACRRVFAMEEAVRKTGNKKLIDDWRKLQTSDHFYYMCTKWFADGDVHKYFNPYETPYEAFIAYTNALHDLELRAANHNKVAVHA